MPIRILPKVGDDPFDAYTDVLILLRLACYRVLKVGRVIRVRDSGDSDACAGRSGVFAYRSFLSGGQRNVTRGGQLLQLLDRESCFHLSTVLSIY